MRRFLAIVVIGLLVFLLACGKTPEQSANQPPSATGQPASTPEAQPASTPAAQSPAAAPGGRPAGTVPRSAPGAKPAAEAAASVVVPAGHNIVVRLDQPLGSKISNTGDNFSATISEPVDVNGRVVIPSGATATGTVADAKALGRFKGGAVLRIVLNAVTVGGKTYKLETEAVSHTAKGKGKRSAVAIGGGAALGALIGGLAGGGKGAGIGAAAGAGAGTAGAAFTGNKDVVLPAESMVSFKLLQPVEVK
jgi:hypothetical protein